MLNLALDVQLLPTDDPEEVEVAVAAHLEAETRDGRRTVEPIPEGFAFHRMHLARRVRKSKRPLIGL